MTDLASESYSDARRWREVEAMPGSGESFSIAWRASWSAFVGLGGCDGARLAFACQFDESP